MGGMRRRRAVVEWTEQEAVASAQFIDITSLPPDIGPGWLEMESPDCQVTYIVIETKDKVQRVTRYTSGPASRVGCWLRDGASIKAIVHAVVGNHVTSKGLTDPGGVVDAKLITRFFPGLTQEPSQPQVVWVLDGSGSSRADGVKLAAASNTALGYVPGYCRYGTAVANASQTIRVGFRPSHSALVYPGAGVVRLHHNMVLNPSWTVHAYNSSAGLVAVTLSFQKEPYTRTSMDN